MSFGTYYRIRAVRLLPMVAISAVAFELIVYVRQFITFEAGSISLWGTILTALGIQCGWAAQNPAINNPVWYISVLMLCYVLLYFAAYLERRLQTPARYYFIFLIFLGMGIHVYSINLPFMTLDSSRGYCAFFYGVLLAEQDERITAGRNQWKWVLGCLLTAIAIVLMIIYLPESLRDGERYVFTFILFPAIIILFSLDPLKSLFKGKWIGHLSQISFHVYIWHSCFLLIRAIVWKILQIDTPESYATMFRFTAVMFMIGAISYLFIQKPLDRALTKKKN